MLLLVDDDPLVRSDVKRLLDRLGHQVLTATDGRRAIQVVTERSRNLLAVVTDFAMPGLEGAETSSSCASTEGTYRS